MKYKIGETLLAFSYDDFLGYYRGNELGLYEIVIVLDSKKVNGVEYYMTTTIERGWEVYRDFELFKNKQEMDKVVN